MIILLTVMTKENLTNIINKKQEAKAVYIDWDFILNVQLVS